MIKKAEVAREHIRYKNTNGALYPFLRRIRRALAVFGAMLAIHLLSCASVRPVNNDTVLFRRAIVDKQDVDEAIAFEAELKARYDEEPPAGTPWFQVLTGTIP